MDSIHTINIYQGSNSAKYCVENWGFKSERANIVPLVKESTVHEK